MQAGRNCSSAAPGCDNAPAAKTPFLSAFSGLVDTSIFRVVLQMQGGASAFGQRGWRITPPPRTNWVVQPRRYRARGAAAEHPATLVPTSGARYIPPLHLQLFCAQAATKDLGKEGVWSTVAVVNSRQLCPVPLHWNPASSQLPAPFPSRLHPSPACSTQPPAARMFVATNKNSRKRHPFCCVPYALTPFCIPAPTDPLPPPRTAHPTLPPCHEPASRCTPKEAVGNRRGNAVARKSKTLSSPDRGAGARVERGVGSWMEV